MLIILPWFMLLLANLNLFSGGHLEQYQYTSLNYEACSFNHQHPRENFPHFSKNLQFAITISDCTTIYLPCHLIILWLRHHYQWSDQDLPWFSSGCAKVVPSLLCISILKVIYLLFIHQFSYSISIAQKQLPMPIWYHGRFDFIFWSISYYFKTWQHCLANSQYRSWLLCKLNVYFPISLIRHPL